MIMLSISLIERAGFRNRKLPIFLCLKHNSKDHVLWFSSDYATSIRLIRRCRIIIDKSLWLNCVS